jgi:hypothetical protein
MSYMNSECLRIADQLRRAFAGDPWHGPPLSEILSGIPAEQASLHPLPSAHSIWELVLHIGVYVNAATDAVEGVAMPKIVGTPKDWPSVTGTSGPAWKNAVDGLFQSGEKLAQAIEAFTDARLQDTVPGRDYDFYYLFHGIVQHSLYHGGQIAMLKRAVSTTQ